MKKLLLLCRWRVEKSTSTRNFNLIGGSPFDGYLKGQVGIKRIAVGEIKDEDPLIENAEDMCVYITVCETHRHYRSKSKAPAGTPEFLFREHL